MTLASRGDVVAAPMHPRGKDKDISGRGVRVAWLQQASRVIDVLRWKTQNSVPTSKQRQERIGVVGHSNGGDTALAVAGAKPSTGAIIAHCLYPPHYF